MNRIVVVDENSELLARLQTLESASRQEELVWAPSLEAARIELRRQPSDVLLLYLRPGMSGVRPFLHDIDEQFPEILRIALADAGHDQDVAHLAPLLHHLLSGSCTAAILQQTIDRGTSLRKLLRGPDVRGLVLAVKHLPTISGLYLRLQQLLADPEVETVEIARLVEQDPAVTAELLHLANSAFFGRPRSVYHVTDAIIFLGRDIVRSLVLSYSVFHHFDRDDSAAQPFLRPLQRHSLLTSRIAVQIVAPAYRDATFVAAILHDIGILLIADRLPKRFAEILAAARRREIPFHVAEYERDGASHAELGGYLLDLWGLPPAIVEAVSHHHMPTRVRPVDFDALAAVHVADALAEEAGVCALPGIRALESRSVVGYLACFGLEKRLPGWQRIAQRDADRLRAMGNSPA